MGISAVHPEAAVSIASRNESGRRLSTEEGLPEAVALARLSAGEMGSGLGGQSAPAAAGWGLEKLKF